MSASRPQSGPGEWNESERMEAVLVITDEQGAQHPCRERASASDGTSAEDIVEPHPAEGALRLPASRRTIARR